MFVIVWKIALATAVLLIAVHYAAEGFKTAKEAYHLFSAAKKTDK